MTYMSTQQGKDCIQKIEVNAKCVVEVMGSGLGRSIGRRQSNMKVFDELTFYAEANIKGTKVRYKLFYRSCCTHFYATKYVNYVSPLKGEI